MDGCRFNKGLLMAEVLNTNLTNLFHGFTV
jgi:hypothetical protein